MANGWTTGLTHVAGSGSDRVLVFVAGSDSPTPDSDLTAVTYGGQSLVLARQKRKVNRRVHI